MSIIKNTFLLLCLVFVLGCDTDKSLNCFQAAGNIVQVEFTVAPFTKILVWERTQLIIQQGPEQKVVVESGENLLNDIELQVVEGRLNIYNNNGCNLVRDYGITRVIVTSPNITEIRSSSGLPVESIGVLNYPNLLLLSEDQENEDEFHIDGDFRLDLAVGNLEIVANGLSKFYIKGSAEYASIGFYAGDSRFEGADFIVQNLQVFHRSTNKMIVNPQLSITGQILSIGDVIAKNRPPIVNVEELYVGRLIFE